MSKKPPEIHQGSAEGFSPRAALEEERFDWVMTPDIPPDYRGPANRPYLKFSDENLGRPLVELLQAAVLKHSGRVAFEDASQTVTFERLWRDTCHLAARIAAHPSRADMVGVMLPANANYAAAVFACLAAGRTCVLLDAGYPMERTRNIAAVVGLRLMLVPSDGGATFPDAMTINVEAALDDKNPASSLPSLKLDQDAPAFILCTSGSTGRPKAIAHSQRTMLHWVRSITNALHIEAADRVLSVSSPSMLGGLTSLLTFPLAGAASQMVGAMPGGFRELMETIGTRQVTLLRATPSLLRSLAGLPDVTQALGSLRAVQTYGEPLLKADVSLLRACLPRSCLIRSTYGATESSGLSWFAGEPDDHDPVRTATGTLMPDTHAIIVGENGDVCGVGEVGELLIRSRYNALGEVMDGQIVPGRLMPDAENPILRVYRTGDLARRTAEGVFVVLGRKDRMIKINGQRVEPAEVETALRRLPDVLQAAVIVRQEHQSSVLLAFVTSCGPAVPELASLIRAALKTALPGYMVPSRVFVLDSLPLLPGGKIDEAALLAHAFI